MSYKTYKNCLHCMLIAAFMLFFQATQGQQHFEKVDNWLHTNLEDLGGRAVLLIYKDGKIIHSVAENNLNMKQEAAIKYLARKTGKDQAELLKDFDGESKINIASCSKWLSAALVMTFIDEGKLNLDDTIGKFLPVMTINGKGNISITDCLTHQTGIKSGNLKESLGSTTDAANMQESMNQIAALPMEAAPGTSFHYSSIGLQIAAAVIEKISGKDFETLFRERIALPCNMPHTDFGHKQVPLAAGGARSTGTDYLHFLSMILQKGKYGDIQILSAKSLNIMQQDYRSGKKIIYSPEEAGSWGYGFGEWVVDQTAKNNAPMLTSPGLFGSFPWIDQYNQYAAVLFCFNIHSKGRHERYTVLKQLVDASITNNLK